MRLLAVVLCAALATAQSWSCPSGWSLYTATRKCVRAYSTKRTWASAVSACKAVGGNLVTITNLAENNFVWGKRLAESWIGLNDRTAEKKWVWQDGSKATYRYWRTGEPNNAKNNEDCAVVGGWGGSKQWGDVGCTATRAYICGRAAITPRPTTKRPTTARPTTKRPTTKSPTKMPTKRSSCPTGWSFYAPTTKCIRAYSTKRSWTSAQAYCRLAGATLVTISSLAENNFVYGKRIGESWIGLNDRTTEKKWSWIDGSTSSYRYWRTGEPNNANGNEDCAVLGGWGGSRQWGDVRCTNTRAYICAMTIQTKRPTTKAPTTKRPTTKRPTTKRPTTKTPTKTPTFRSTCPTGWSYYSPTQKCIRAYGSPKRSWTSAQAYCRVAGATLISITSLAENTFAYSKRIGESWIGLNDRTTEKKWSWIDGSKSTYRYWRTGEPNNANGNEDCAVLGGWGGSRQWGDVRCTNTRAFICAMTIKTKRPTTKSPTTKRPTTKRPTTKRPTTKRPTTKRPTTRKPTKKPTKKPTPPAAEETATEGAGEETAPYFE